MGALGVDPTKIQEESVESFMCTGYHWCVCRYGYSNNRIKTMGVDLDELNVQGYTTFRTISGLSHKLPNDLLKNKAPELLALARSQADMISKLQERWVKIDDPIVSEWVKTEKWFLLMVKGIPTTGDFRKSHISSGGDWWLGGYGWYEDFKGEADMICICPHPI